MKLYLSSYRIPVPDELFQLVGKPASSIKLALLPNAKDYYAKRAKAYKIQEIIAYQKERGIGLVDTVDLLDYRSSDTLRKKLRNYDVVWAVGGNTFCLRQEMRRSGFEVIVNDLLDDGIVYGGDSAGAVAAGTSLRGIESVDIPDFTEDVIYDGLSLVPQVIIPHVGNEYFTEANNVTRSIHAGQAICEISDDEALIINGDMTKKVHANIPEIDS